MDKKKIINITFFLITLLLYACEYEAQISYKVINESSYKLKVIFNNNGKDQTVNIDTSESKIIVVHEQGLSSVDNYQETGDLLSGFNRMDIYKNDTINSQTDYKKTENWTWHKYDSHTAEYAAIVNDFDFEE